MCRKESLRNQKVRSLVLVVFKTLQKDICKQGISQHRILLSANFLIVHRSTSEELAVYSLVLFL